MDYTPIPRQAFAPLGPCRPWLGLALESSARFPASDRAIQAAGIVSPDDLLPFHTRFPFAWRQDIEEAVVGRFGKGGRRPGDGLCVLKCIKASSAWASPPHRRPQPCDRRRPRIEQIGSQRPVRAMPLQRADGLVSLQTMSMLGGDLIRSQQLEVHGRIRIATPKVTHKARRRPGYVLDMAGGGRVASMARRRCPVRA